jgi:hypothetical protein
VFLIKIGSSRALFCCLLSYLTNPSLNSFQGNHPGLLQIPPAVASTPHSVTLLPYSLLHRSRSPNSPFVQPWKFFLQFFPLPSGPHRTTASSPGCFAVLCTSVLTQSLPTAVSFFPAYLPPPCSLSPDRPHKLDASPIFCLPQFSTSPGVQLCLSVFSDVIPRIRNIPQHIAGGQSCWLTRTSLRLAVLKVILKQIFLCVGHLDSFQFLL